MKSKTNPKIDFYFNKEKKWKEEIKKLRTIVLESGLEENLKWGVPCYTLNPTEESKDRNIVLIHVFKEYCALLFFKGVLLKDPNGILIQQTKNVQSGRQIRFTNVETIEELESVLKKYINEAIKVEKLGLKVEFKKADEFETTKELQYKFINDKKFKKAFEELTPGRQRGYKLYFASPKQSKTREARIEKYVKHIMNGKGLNDI